MKLRNTIIAMSLATSFAAVADPIQFDLSQYQTTTTPVYDGIETGTPVDLVTNYLSALNGPVDFKPVSTYMDDDGNAGLTVGDSVQDVGSNVVVLSDPGSTEPGTNGVWELQFSYVLDGVLVDIDSEGNYNSVFTSGSAQLDVYDVDIASGSGDKTTTFLGTLTNFSYVNTDVVTFNPVANTIDLDIWFDAVSVTAGTQFIGGKDVGDLVNDSDSWTNFRLGIGIELSDLDQAPTETGPNSGVYTREVFTSSPDLTFFAVPEPGSLALFGLGLLGLAGAARRRK